MHRGSKLHPTAAFVGRRNWQRVIRDVTRRGNTRISGKSVNIKDERNERQGDPHSAKNSHSTPLGSESVPDLLERFATGANLLVASAAHTFPSTCSNASLSFPSSTPPSLSLSLFFLRFLVASLSIVPQHWRRRLLQRNRNCETFHS